MPPYFRTVKKVRRYIKLRYLIQRYLLTRVRMSCPEALSALQSRKWYELMMPQRNMRPSFVTSEQ